jgi:NAD(P)-dependent dehydrogenase (short-subunit alcohol dehydrogenase family)
MARHEIRTDHDMDYQLAGKLAFVSAGAHGIGESIANLLAREGAEVIVADQDEAALQAHGSTWRGTIAADLSTGKGVDRSF